MTILTCTWRGLDTAFEALVLLCLIAVVFVVLWQVFARQLLGSSTRRLADADGLRRGLQLAAERSPRRGGE